MWATNLLSSAPWRTRSSQSGTAAVEVALLMGIFLVFVFGVIELARVMYVYNTLQEVTRRVARASVHVDFQDNAALSRIRQRAIFRDSPGELVLAAPVSDRHIRIDYLSLTRKEDGSMTMTPIAESSLPSCPALNRQICMADPNSPSCIRFVRARICDPENPNGCDPVQFKTIFPLVALPLNLPKATTIATAESLGFLPGTPPCP